MTSLVAPPIVAGARRVRIRSGTEEVAESPQTVDLSVHVEKYACRPFVVVIESGWMDVVVVFGVALVTALATGLGAVPFAFARRPDRSWLGTPNSLAAGFMLGASLGLMYEGSDYGLGRTAIGVFAGIRTTAEPSGLTGAVPRMRRISQGPSIPMEPYNPPTPGYP